MAPNEIYDGQRIAVAVSSPSTPASGDPVRYGRITGVALAAKDTTTNLTPVDFGNRTWDVSVKAVDDTGNNAVAVGDRLYYVDADTPKISKKASGTFFGIALEAITAGSTDTINVMHFGQSVSSGFIPLAITAARLISTNDIPNTVGDAGVLSSNSAPALARVNGATDKKLRISWAASGVVGVTWNVDYPIDLDGTQPVTVNVLCAMAGTTDTPTIAVNYFEGVGDTNAGGNTAAVTGTAVAKYSRTIAAADVGEYPNAASVELVPAAHGTDALYLYGAWIEYVRK